MESGWSALVVFLKYTNDDDAILISTANPYFPTFICKNILAILICRNSWTNFTYNYLWNFCVKYESFESEIRRNYEMLWIFLVSFEESLTQGKILRNTTLSYATHVSTVLSVLHRHLLVLVPYFATHSAPFARIHKLICK